MYNPLEEYKKSLLRMSLMDPDEAKDPPAALSNEELTNLVYLLVDDLFTTKRELEELRRDLRHI